MKPTPLALIDCHNLGYRAAHTTGNMSHNGQPTGVIYGFLNQVFKFIKDQGFHELIFCWDSRKSLRREIYPDYKGRPTQDLPALDYDAVYEQFDELRGEVLPALGFGERSYWREGYEADDLIAWVCIRQKDIRSSVIVSSDNDLYQLLSPLVRVYNVASGKFYTEDILMGHFGIAPDKWSLLKAIAGCTSDNVKGVRGVGEKTAAKWIRAELKLDSKAARSIRESIDLVQRNIRLVSLPFGGGWPDFTLKPTNMRKRDWYQVFRKYGFQQFIGRLQQLTMLFGLK